MKIGDAFSLCAVLALIAGCGAGKGAPSGSTASGGSGPATSAGPTSSSSSAGGAGGTGGSPIVSVGSGGSPGDAGPPPDVYINSSTQLFAFDVDTMTISLIGPLTGCSDAVQDIALDDQDNLVASDGTTMWHVDRTTGACLDVAASGPAGSLPVAFTFVPKETFGTTDQALVGYTSASDYVRVDLSTNTVTQIGQLGGGYSLTGDFVAVDQGPTFVSVHGNGCNGDCIVEIDVTTGAVTKSLGSTGYSENGLAFWGGVVYGFNTVGDVVATTVGGSGPTTAALSINPNGYLFVGAGSTTAAPLAQ